MISTYATHPKKITIKTDFNDCKSAGNLASVTADKC